MVFLESNKPVALIGSKRHSAALVQYLTMVVLMDKNKLIGGIAIGTMIALEAAAFTWAAHMAVTRTKMDLARIGPNSLYRPECLPKGAPASPSAP